MSVKVTGWVWEQPFTTSEKIVALKLADHADHDGDNVYPSVAEISSRTGLGERQVKRYLKDFVERGILEIRNHEHGGRGHARVYRFTFRFAAKGDTSDTIPDRQRVTPATPIAHAKGDTHDTDSNPERVTSGTPKGDTGDMQRVTPVTEKGDIHARANQNRPEPSFKPSKNQTGARELSLRESFELFQAAYPSSHINPKTAWDQWQRLKPDPEIVEVILLALERWKASDQWQRGFIKQAHNWLREEWWNSDPPPPPRDADDRDRPWLDTPDRNEPFDFLEGMNRKRA